MILNMENYVCLKETEKSNIYLYIFRQKNLNIIILMNSASVFSRYFFVSSNTNKVFKMLDLRSLSCICNFCFWKTMQERKVF